MKSSPPKKASTAGQKSKLKPVAKATAKIETQWVEPKQRQIQKLKVDADLLYSRLVAGETDEFKPYQINNKRVGKP